jgi:hypothetical protein
MTRRPCAVSRSISPSSLPEAVELAEYATQPEERAIVAEIATSVEGERARAGLVFL